MYVLFYVAFVSSGSVETTKLLILSLLCRVPIPVSIATRSVKINPPKTVGVMVQNKAACFRAHGVLAEK